MPHNLQHAGRGHVAESADARPTAPHPVIVAGVIDVRRGRAVHAQGGVRSRYRPVAQVGHVDVPQGDLTTVVRAYRAMGLRALYVADLDAIEHQDLQEDALRRMDREGVPLWIDAAADSVQVAGRVLALGASRLVVGLETLPSFDVLDDICRMAPSGTVLFSLDLRDGQPIGAPGRRGADGPPETLAQRAAACGAAGIIVLDLARVGSGAGPDIRLVERIRRAVPSVLLLSGGGVRSADDLTSLSRAGCDGALVGTALLTGAIGADECSALSRLES